ncbi:Uu.00g052160.m01.CDS01 [Anthostomella pinea]|uniref:Rho GDP-dissociation inhibitor n=1 Tax=Anthostomella pinea TaxID=933095 RepID=A0AAI8YPI7_9PEZI|nr:Uu.00g052160.m01.CDS01 [Anthostomella pinea]
MSAPLNRQQTRGRPSRSPSPIENASGSGNSAVSASIDRVQAWFTSNQPINLNGDSSTLSTRQSTSSSQQAAASRQLATPSSSQQAQGSSTSPAEMCNILVITDPGRPAAVLRKAKSFFNKMTGRNDDMESLASSSEDEDRSNWPNGLDPRMTCRGLPGSRFMTREEVTVSSQPASPSLSTAPTATASTSAPPAPEGDIISHFQVTRNISPDKTNSTDANDESLQRYKQSLGLGGGKDLSDPNDPRVCIIKSLTMESPGRPPVTIDLSAPGSEATLKDHPFKIKEGAKFTMVASFCVQHEILSGLQYVQIVKRKGIKVSKDSEMLGSYAPSTDKQPVYQKRFQEEDAPSGMLARGHYNAVSSFVDDDKKNHLQFEWSFDIAKDW